MVIALTIIILTINGFKIYNESKLESTIKENEISSKIEIYSLSEKTIDSIAKILPEKVFLRDSKIGDNNIVISYEKENKKSTAGRSFSRYYLTLSSYNVKLENNYLLHSFETKNINQKKFKYKIQEIGDLIYLKNIEIKFDLNIRNKNFTDFINTNNYKEITLSDIE